MQQIWPIRWNGRKTLQNLGKHFVSCFSEITEDEKETNTKHEPMAMAWQSQCSKFSFQNSQWERQVYIGQNQKESGIRLYDFYLAIEQNDNGYLIGLVSSVGSFPANLQR